MNILDILLYFYFFLQLFQMLNSLSLLFFFLWFKLFTLFGFLMHIFLPLGICFVLLLFSLLTTVLLHQKYTVEVFLSLPQMALVMGKTVFWYDSSNQVYGILGLDIECTRRNPTILLILASGNGNAKPWMMSSFTRAQSSLGFEDALLWFSKVRAFAT